MNRYTPLRARAPLPQVNPERRRKKFERNFGDHSSWVRAQGCQLASRFTSNRTPCEGRIEACHVSHAGMGGAKGDRRHLVGGCRRHHAELDGRSPLPNGSGPQSFEAHYRVDVHKIAADNWTLSPFGAATEAEHAV